VPPHFTEEFFPTVLVKEEVSFLKNFVLFKREISDPLRKQQRQGEMTLFWTDFKANLILSRSELCLEFLFLSLGFYLDII